MERPFGRAERELIEELAQQPNPSARDICDLALMCHPIRSYRDVRDAIAESRSDAALEADERGEGRMREDIPAAVHYRQSGASSEGEGDAAGTIGALEAVEAMLRPMLGMLGNKDKAELIRLIASSVE